MICKTMAVIKYILFRTLCSPCVQLSTNPLACSLSDDFYHKFGNLGHEVIISAERFSKLTKSLSKKEQNKSFTWFKCVKLTLYKRKKLMWETGFCGDSRVQDNQLSSAGSQQSPVLKGILLPPSHQNKTWSIGESRSGSFSHFGTGCNLMQRKYCQLKMAKCTEGFYLTNPSQH